jgi:hypothetical protein
MGSMSAPRAAAALALAALLVVGAAPAASASPGCEVSGATLDWGFKESFRAYIDGSIANGEWATTDGAVYSTPEFGWRAGAGSIDPVGPGGVIAFAGSVRFTGHDGVLDTTIANPAIRLDGPESATLLLDVTGPTMEGDPVDEIGVAFVRIDLSTAELASSTDGIVVSSAPTTLTEDGAAAFPNYDPGEAFDPISFVLPAPGCEIRLDRPGGDGWVAYALIPLVLAIGAIAVPVLLVRRRST